MGGERGNTILPGTRYQVYDTYNKTVSIVRTYIPDVVNVGIFLACCCVRYVPSTYCTYVPTYRHIINYVVIVWVYHKIKNVSCEIEDFVETYLRKLRGILRSCVLRFYIIGIYAYMLYSFPTPYILPFIPYPV